MTDFIKKQFRFKYQDTRLMLLMGLFGFIGGKLLLTAILFFDRSTNTYFPLAAVIMTASVLGGTLNLKYGKKAGWTLWGLWMIGCFTLPRISDAAPNTPAGLLKTTLQRFLHILPPFLRIALIAAIMILCIICSWLLLRRQQVNS